MKKILCLILIFMLCPIGFCTPQTSQNAFEILIDEVPPGGEEISAQKQSGGLSDGAVTAITLGSVFGGLGILGGLGWYFAKHMSGLACGFACGMDKPIKPIFLADFCKDFSNNKYLEKVFGFLDKSSDKKYLFIPDTEINNRTYHTIIFEIPKDMPNFKIVQISDSMLNTSVVVSDKEIPTKSYFQEKFLIKKGKFSFTSEKCAALAIKNLVRKTTYSMIIEFSKN